MKVDHKGDTLEAILLPKVLRPWIITSTHEFYGYQGGDCCFYKIRATFLEWHEKLHLSGHFQLQNGITQFGQVHELILGNWHNT